MQEKCTEDGMCHDWTEDKSGELVLENCTYSCLKDAHFQSNCYQRKEKADKTCSKILDYVY